MHDQNQHPRHPDRTEWSGDETVHDQNQRNLPAAGPMSKMFSSERLVRDASDLFDLTAPESLSRDEEPAKAINFAYRYAHGTTIWAGTSEVHRSMIAERVLGLPRSRN